MPENSYKGIAHLNPNPKIQQTVSITGKGVFKGRVVRLAGLEPARPCGRQILSLLCLPISPQTHTLAALLILFQGLSIFICNDLSAPKSLFWS
tara:strand:+ start:15793 stop:16071 length:279 start_codon:yes stop_codon:yes gene_type:complete